MAKLIGLLLVGLSVGLGNFAASIAIGLGGVSKSQRNRIAIVFGLFETVMPIVGLLVGHQIAVKFGGDANILGGSLLGLTGAYLVFKALHKSDDLKVKKASGGWGKLLLAGLSLSIDNLIIGFGLGTHHQSILLVATVIAISSVSLTLLGLELGSRLGSKAKEYSEIISGAVLILVGLAVGFKVL